MQAFVNQTKWGTLRDSANQKSMSSYAKSYNMCYNRRPCPAKICSPPEFKRSPFGMERETDYSSTYVKYPKSAFCKEKPTKFHFTDGKTYRTKFDVMPNKYADHPIAQYSMGHREPHRSTYCSTYRQFPCLNAETIAPPRANTVGLPSRKLKMENKSISMSSYVHHGSKNYVSHTERIRRELVKMGIKMGTNSHATCRISKPESIKVEQEKKANEKYDADLIIDPNDHAALAKQTMSYLRHCEQEDGKRLKHMQELRDLNGEEGDYPQELYSCGYAPLKGAGRSGRQELGEDVDATIERLKEQRENDLKCLRTMQKERDGSEVCDDCDVESTCSPPKDGGDSTKTEVGDGLEEGVRSLNIGEDKLSRNVGTPTKKPCATKIKTRKSDSAKPPTPPSKLKCRGKVVMDKSAKVQSAGEKMMTYAERLDQHLEGRKACQGFVFTPSKIGAKNKLKSKAEIEEMKRRAEMVVLGRESVNVQNMVNSDYPPSDKQDQTTSHKKPETPAVATRIPTPPTGVKKSSKSPRVAFEMDSHKSVKDQEIIPKVANGVTHESQVESPLKSSRPVCRRLPSVNRVANADAGSRGVREMPDFAEVLAKAKAQMNFKPKSAKIPYATLEHRKQ